jgi:hypothetical protein
LLGIQCEEFPEYAQCLQAVHWRCHNHFGRSCCLTE